MRPGERTADADGAGSSGHSGADGDVTRRRSGDARRKTTPMCSRRRPGISPATSAERSWERERLMALVRSERHCIGATAPAAAGGRGNAQPRPVPTVAIESTVKGCHGSSRSRHRRLLRRRVRQDAERLAVQVADGHHGTGAGREPHCAGHRSRFGGSPERISGCSTTCTWREPMESSASGHPVSRLVCRRRE